LAIVALLAFGCGPQTGAALSPLAPRTAIVGQELEIVVRSSVDTSDFGYSSDLADLATRRLHPTLTPYANGEAIFRWTPLGGDVGEHHVDFSATAHGVLSTVRVQITVEGGADPVTFREPVGDGTSLDLARAPCVTVEILVDDTGAAAVTLSPGAPWADGATLKQGGPLDGTLRFCPTAEQAAQTSVFPLLLVADDQSGGHAEKRYTIVVDALADGGAR
jgi:hypothetical protein